MAKKSFVDIDGLTTFKNKVVALMDEKIKDVEAGYPTISAGVTNANKDTNKQVTFTYEGGKLSLGVPAYALTSEVEACATNAALNEVKTSLDAKAPLASPTFTGTPSAPTAADGTSTTQIATTAYVTKAINNHIAAAKAMSFKGTLGEGGDYTTIPANGKAGDLYVVVTAGTYANNIKCEKGDSLICLKDYADDATAEFTAVQANEDGLVHGPTTSIDGNLAVFSGTAGGQIKDSEVTLESIKDAITKATTAAAAKGFAKIKSGDVTTTAANHDDTFEIVGAGNTNVTLAGKVFTISTTVPTYGVATADKDGLMSSAHFTKLEGIAEGAQVNKIESIEVNGVAATIANKKASVTINLDSYAKTTDIVGTTGDSSDADTINGAKKYAAVAADAEKAVVIGTDNDTADKDTVKGAKKYAEKYVAENVTALSESEINALFA